jgi:predicted aminopeptidase
MRLVLVLVLCILSVSCSKISYLVKQGHGQLKLQWGGDKNEKILQSSQVSADIKKKIILVEKYKDFFYSYFEKKKTGIYSKTNFLGRDAVSYLLIASPQHEIKPKEFTFPFVGAFPYIGFFQEADAKEWASDLEREGYEIYLRPVKAYSTLGHLEDHILSTFLDYDELSLAELIFHELFHTIFFLKGDVDFNENLAQYFARELLKEYFAQNINEVEKYYDLRSRQEKLDNLVADFALQLNQLYLTHPNSNAADYQQIRSTFLQSTFNPAIQKNCQTLKIDPCYPLQQVWNNAQFAAWMSYHQYQDNIEGMYQKLSAKNLRHFYALLIEKHKMYEKMDTELKFSQYILQESQ